MLVIKSAPSCGVPGWTAEHDLALLTGINVHAFEWDNIRNDPALPFVPLDQESSVPHPEGKIALLKDYRAAQRIEQLCDLFVTEPWVQAKPIPLIKRPSHMARRSGGKRNRKRFGQTVLRRKAALLTLTAKTVIIRSRLRKAKRRTMTLMTTGRMRSDTLVVLVTMMTTTKRMRMGRRRRRRRKVTTAMTTMMVKKAATMMMTRMKARVATNSATPVMKARAVPGEDMGGDD